MNLWLSSFCGLEPPRLPVKALPIFCPRLTAPPPRCGGFASVLPSSAHFLSDARRCWFTFVYRTTGLRAVGDFVVGVLQTHVGRTLTFRPLGLCPASPCLCLDYSTLLAICQALFFDFLGVKPVCPSFHSPRGLFLLC